MEDGESAARCRPLLALRNDPLAARRDDRTRRAALHPPRSWLLPASRPCLGLDLADSDLLYLLGPGAPGRTERSSPYRRRASRPWGEQGGWTERDPAPAGRDRSGGGHHVAAAAAVADGGGGGGGGKTLRMRRKEAMQQHFSRHGCKVRLAGPRASARLSESRPAAGVSWP